MILALISDSFCLILGHFPVLNSVKSSVSGFLRFQDHLGRRWGLRCKKAHKMEETGHSRYLCKKRSPHGRHGDIGIIQSIRRSPLGRHGDRRVAKTIRWVAIWGRHSDPLLQMATSHFIPLSQFEVTIATNSCEWRPHYMLLMVATCSRAKKMVFVATSTSNRYTPQGRHSDQMATSEPHQWIK